MKILITGANGFIGKSLCELLKDEYDIIPIYNVPLNTERDMVSRYEFDIQDEQDVDDMFSIHKNIDFVIHCATVGGRRTKPDTPGVFSCNVNMFNNLIKHNDKFKYLITFGSGAELAEGDFPMNYYGLSKKYITEKIKREDLKAITLRLWGCFGKNETDDRFIKSNIIRYINNESMLIHENKIMDFFYVNDLVPILKWLFENWGQVSSKEIPLTYSQKLSLEQIADKINELDTHKVPIILQNETPGKDYGTSNYIDGPFNFIGLEKGIKEVYESLKNNSK